MNAHKLTLHYIFIAVSLPYLTESEQHACFPRTGHDETSIPTGGLLACFWPETMCRKKEACFQGRLHIEMPQQCRYQGR